MKPFQLTNKISSDVYLIYSFFIECPMMNTIEEDQLPYISPSVVQFSTQIDEIELKPESNWNPDWTIQNEVSITIELVSLIISFSFSFSFLF